MMLSSTQNLSFLAKVLAYIYYIRGFVEATLSYHRAYRNYVNVIISVFRRKYPVDIILKNGSHKLLSNRSEVISLAKVQDQHDIQYDMMTNTWVISNPQYLIGNWFNLKLKGNLDNGIELIYIFMKKIYDSLPVEGRTVIDVGANMGDSSIYFALRGAKKVIGIEPFVKIYEIAKKNIELNNLCEKVTMVLAGCAASSGHIIIDPEYQSNISSRLVDYFEYGEKIPLLTLEDILNEIKISSQEVILKMDCEGCEYDAILYSANETLRRFSHIQIEYHHGYKSLKEKLENCGFHVLVTRPIADPSEYLEEPWQYLGNIYAKRDDLYCG
jgi:FkbM family methyltransferase